MRIIDKDALLSDIERTIEESGCVNHEGEIMDCVRYAPEVEAVPVVRGEWIPAKDPYDRMYCYRHAGCGCEHNEQSAYCPNCGANKTGENGTKKQLNL